MDNQQCQKVLNLMALGTILVGFLSAITKMFRHGYYSNRAWARQDFSWRVFFLRNRQRTSFLINYIIHRK